MDVEDEVEHLYITENQQGAEGQSGKQKEKGGKKKQPFGAEQ